MSFINQYREQLKQHTTSTLLLTALILFTLLLVILRLSLSAIIIVSTERWLASQQLDANIERLDISLFSGHVSLHNAEAQNAQQQGFKIGELTLDWDWLPLFSKHVKINEITLRDFSINAELHHDGGLNIGGIILADNQAEDTAQMPTEQTQANSWQASAHNIQLGNIEVCVAQLDKNKQPLLDYCNQLAQLEWQGQLAYLPEITGTQVSSPALAIYTDGRFDLLKLELHNNLLDLNLLSIAAISLPHVKIESLDNIQLQTMDIRQLALLQQATDNATEQAITDTQANHLLAFDNLQLGPISIMQNRQIALGDITVSGLRSRAPIRSDNQLDIAAWIPGKMAQHTDQVSKADKKPDEVARADSATMQQNNDTYRRSDNTQDQTIHLAINNIQLSDSTLCTDHAGNSQIKPLSYCLKMNNTHWQGTLSYGKQNNLNKETESTSLPLYANGNFTINQLSMKNHSLNLNLLSVENIEFEAIDVETIELIDIAALSIEQLSAFERSQQSQENTTQVQPSYIFSFEQFNIQPIKLSRNALTLGSAELTGSQAIVVINQQGEVEISQWRVQPEIAETRKTPDSPENQQTAAVEKEMQTEAQATATTANTRRFSLEKFILHSEKKTTFIDQSGKQDMQLVIEQIDIQLKNIDSASDAQQSSASLFIRLEDQATLKLDAQGTPLAEKPDIKGSGSISALDLRNFSPITRQQLGQSIRSGQLDAQLDINVQQGQVDSLLDLNFNHFVLRTLNEEEAEKLNKDLGFPLNTSLNLLRDKDNKIHLSIPVTQDMDNLNIDIKPVIYKALSRSVSSAIVNYYTPFGLVFVAESLFDLATALKFKPVVFNPGEASLTQTSKAELEKLATIMNERPGIHLTLCGFSNLSDIAQSNENSTNKTTTEKPAIEISTEQRQQLLQLAGSRSSTVKQYLVNAHQISASRLVECEAEYAADAIAVVEIKL